MTHGQRQRQHRRRGGIALALLLAGACAGASAQVYKWKDAQGVTHYGDAPPAGRQVRTLDAGATPSSGPALPYALARAAQGFPVVLYTTARCDACDQGRALLRTRGIPFSERTVGTREDEQQLRQLSGKTELPLLLVGNRRIAGFQAAAWHEALTTAAYPLTSMLPPGYQQPAPQPAAPAIPAASVAGASASAPDEADAADAAAAERARQQPRQPARQTEQRPKQDDASPDFQF
jgi:glutaredoxin